LLVYLGEVMQDTIQWLQSYLVMQYQHERNTRWSEQCNIDALFLCRVLNSYHMYAAVRCGWGANLGGLAAHVIKVVVKGCSL